MHAVYFERLDPVLPDGDAMLRIAEAVGTIGTSEVQSIEDPFSAGAQHIREEYACEDKRAPGIEPFLHHEGFISAARKVHRRDIVRPNNVTANFLLPGQALAMQTDVPRFRGLNRGDAPDWLLIAAHHSGLFEQYRIPVATALAWFGESRNGSELIFYPDGVYEQSVVLPVKPNTALVLDTDTVVHCIERVENDSSEMPKLPPGATLNFKGDDQWTICSGDETLANYKWADLRLCVSWKAYCYADEAEEKSVADKTNDLDRAQVLETLEATARKRGRLKSPEPGEQELALAIINTFIQLPPTQDAD